jgi:hypothetical protein
MGVCDHCIIISLLVNLFNTVFFALQVRWVHDPYRDCICGETYKRMCSQDHKAEGSKTLNIGTGFHSWKSEELAKMTPDDLYDISRSNIRC